MSGLSRARADVIAAESTCERARVEARQSVQRLKDELQRAATPGRIVAGGLGLGFFAGRAGPGAAKSARFAAGPIFQLLGNTLLPALMAGFAAAQAADEAEGEAISEDEATGESDAQDGYAPDADTLDAEPDPEHEPEETDDGPPPPSRRRRRRR